MTDDQHITCPHCEKPIDAAWEFCPFCGQGTHVAEDLPPPPTEPLAPAPPALEELRGPCTILATRPLPSDLTSIGRTVAKLLELSLTDVTSAMHLSKGTIARGVDAEQARQVRSAICSAELPILLIPDDQMLTLDATRPLRGAVREGAEIRGEASDSLGNWEAVSIPLSDILFAAAVRIRSDTRVMVTEETDAEAEMRERLERSVFGRLAKRRFIRKKQEPKEVFRPTHRHLISLFTREPLVRYDIEEQSFDFRMMQALPPDFGSAVGLAQMLHDAAPHLAANSGMALLRAGQSERGWEPLTFVSRTGAAAYYDWLLQRAGRGHGLSL